jgi:hypothetical protein
MVEATKVASRFLLPLEMYLGLSTLAWGLSAGGLGRAGVQILLDEPGAAAAWVVALVLLGAVQAGVACAEWLVGRYWPQWRVVQCAKLRTGIAFINFCVWLWILKSVLAAPTADQVPILVFHAPLTVYFLGWVFVENFKVRLAADERISTSTLQFHR